MARAATGGPQVPTSLRRVRYRVRGDVVDSPQRKTRGLRAAAHVRNLYPQEADTGALARRNTFFLVAALTLSLSVLAWLRPLEATQRDVQMDNAERLRRGIATLRESSSLDRVALRHSQEMAQKGQIWHADWTQRASEPWIAYGENVGAGPSLQAIHDAFMNSPDHRRNILEPFFKEMGAGVVDRDGTTYVTEIFVTRPRRVPFKAPPDYPGGHRIPRVRPSAPRPRPRPPRASERPLTVWVLLRLLEFNPSD